jgi:hypothetical protein
VPFRTQGYFINMGRQLSLILRSRVIICIIKAGKYSRKGVVCRGIQSAQDGFDSTYPQDCSLTYYEFCKTGVRLSQLHKSKTVYVVDGVASRYTNSRTYGLPGFDCNTQVLLRIVPTITQSYTTFSAADLELAA